MEPTDDRQDVIPIVCQVPDGDLPHIIICMTTTFKETTPLTYMSSRSAEAFPQHISKVVSSLKSTSPRKGGEVVLNTQTSIPCDKSHKVQSAFKDWMIHEECSSHHVSQFAAFFIVARAERSIVKSCFDLTF